MCSAALNAGVERHPIVSIGLRSTVKIAQYIAGHEQEYLQINGVRPTLRRISGDTYPMIGISSMLLSTMSIIVQLVISEAICTTCGENRALFGKSRLIPCHDCRGVLPRTVLRLVNTEGRWMFVIKDK